MILVELFSKEDCSLCDEARAVLETVRQEIPFTLKETKLIPGEGNFDEFKDDFPVVHINKRFAFKHRLNETSVRIRIQQVVNEGKRSSFDQDTETGSEEAV